MNIGGLVVMPVYVSLFQDVYFRMFFCSHVLCGVLLLTTNTSQL